MVQRSLKVLRAKHRAVNTLRASNSESEFLLRPYRVLQCP